MGMAGRGGFLFLTKSAIVASGRWGQLLGGQDHRVSAAWANDRTSGLSAISRPRFFLCGGDPASFRSAAFLSEGRLLMSKYNFTQLERWAVFETHGGRCWLCPKPLDFQNMVIDH